MTASLVAGAKPVARQTRMPASPRRAITSAAPGTASTPPAATAAA